MNKKEINTMTPEEYQEYLKTIDPDTMGFDEGVEGVQDDDANNQ